eukprot:TRINITY_DN28808_c0_g1_i1.p1 TRINITY_DN28808_c0_g1~~TRINITY_DN28808_c0_g1_i1.p1  ORF type:complete len:576 (-),score=49.57 TRINITY_DN28808_c0_g1_i1:69-1796(-)
MTDPHHLHYHGTMLSVSSTPMHSPNSPSCDEDETILSRSRSADDGSSNCTIESDDCSPSSRDNSVSCDSVHSTLSGLSVVRGAIASWVTCSKYASKSMRRELHLLFRLSWPVALSNFCRLCMAVTDTSVLGHLGTEYLAACSLAWVWMDLTGTFAWAPLDALSTLCSQAYGAKNYSLVGSWFQIGVVVSCLLAVPLTISWMCTGLFLEFIGIDPYMADLAQQFASWSAFWLLPDSLYYAICLYFQSQEIVFPILIINLSFVAVNILINIVLVYGVRITIFSTCIMSWDGLGYIGSPLATSVTRVLLLLFAIGYLFRYKKMHVKTWPSHPWSFSRTMTKDRFKEFLKLSVPQTISTAVESWQLEVVTFFASRLGVVEVATQTGLFNMFYTLHCFAYGLSQAANVRVAHHLGANDAKEARQAARIASGITAMIGSLIGLSLYVFRNSLVRIYSQDPAVWELNDKVAWTNSVAFFSVSMLLTMTSILQAQGRPHVVAIIGNVCSWGISVPLAYYAAFHLQLGIVGLWVGLLTAYSVYFVLSGTLVLFSDWTKHAKQAVDRSVDAAGESQSLLTHNEAA